MREIDAFAEQMPRIDAEEAMHDVTVAMLGSGACKKSTAQGIMRRWQRMAQVKAHRRPADLKSAAASLGIGYYPVQREE